MESFIDRINLWLRRHYNVRGVIIFILFLLCVFELVSIWRGLETVYTGTDPYLSYHHGQVIREIPVVRPSDIQPWMTFRYVNFVFKLPPNYLSDTLSLSDPRYPNVQIVRYARMHDLDLSTFMQKVQSSVAQYSVPPTF